MLRQNLIIGEEFQKKKAPEILKVNDGFHHDLNANVNDELKGPSFPYKNRIEIYTKYDN